MTSFKRLATERFLPNTSPENPIQSSNILPTTRPPENTLEDIIQSTLTKKGELFNNLLGQRNTGFSYSHYISILLNLMEEEKQYSASEIESIYVDAIQKFKEAPLPKRPTLKKVLSNLTIYFTKENTALSPKNAPRYFYTVKNKEEREKKVSLLNEIALDIVEEGEIFSRHQFETKAKEKGVENPRIVLAQLTAEGYINIRLNGDLLLQNPSDPHCISQAMQANDQLVPI